MIAHCWLRVAEAYLFKTLQMIRTAELEEVLLVHIRAPHCCLLFWSSHVQSSLADPIVLLLVSCDTQALLLLPFDYAGRMLRHLDAFIQKVLHRPLNSSASACWAGWLSVALQQVLPAALHRPAACSL